jgi:hypothetical protein
MAGATSQRHFHFIPSKRTLTGEVICSSPGGHFPDSWSGHRPRHSAERHAQEIPDVQAAAFEYSLQSNPNLVAEQRPLEQKAATMIRQKNNDSFAAGDDHQVKGSTPAQLLLPAQLMGYQERAARARD